jgi:hypothetical protein
VPGFTLQTPLRRSPVESWNPAFSVVDLKDYFGNTSRGANGAGAAVLAKQQAEKLAFYQWWFNVKRWVKQVCKFIFQVSVTMLIVTGLIYYALISGAIDRGRQHLLRFAHVQVYVLIQHLKDLDRRYLVPPAVPRSVR